MVHSEGSKQCQATGGAIVRFLWSGLDRSYVCSTCVLCVCPGPSCAFLPVESQDRRVGNGFVCHAHLGQEAVGDTGDRRSLEGRGCDGMRGMVIPYDCLMCRVRICMWRHHAVQHHAVRGGRTMGDAADGAGPNLATMP